MGQRIVVADAFTDRPFRGNPAAICILPGPADECWMRDVARELNLSETAFLYPEGDPGAFRLRWFTPAVEVDLCGHATLGSAHVLWEDGHVPPDAPARFVTRSGPLSASRSDGRIWLDFPAKPAGPAAKPEGLDEALGVRIVAVARNAFDYLVEVESAEVLRGLRPDLGRLALLPVRGLIVTAAADDPDFDFVSRFFAPASGVDEDPVTGSAHCALGPFWGPRLGKSDLRGYQASARGGVVDVRLDGDRVHLGGHAVTVWRGELVGGAAAG